MYAIPAGEWNGVSHGGVGEWIMYHLKIPAPDYMPLSRRFNPVSFDADAWAAMAADAGVKYVVITTKHHDGFSLFDSAHATFDVMDATPFGRDVMKELAQACERRGLRMGWYHSILDWTHPLAQSAETYPEYVKVLRGQVTELLTNYGPIGVMWFDGEWDANWTNDMGKDLYDLCRSIQPWTIVNNRVGKGRQGMAGLTAAGDFPGDFGTPEQEIPSTGLAGQDWESCMTMNDTWGYKASDSNWKSPETLIRMLVETTSKGGNFLLNVGPTAQGLIPEPSVERFAAIARWMKANHASIHGAGASPFRRLPWGRCTTRPGRLYMHVFEWPADGVLRVPGLLNTVTAAAALATGQKLSPVRDAAGWSIDLDGVPRDLAS
ncbi:MAG TPA: alpha-L-fucosidase, partial [Phycisphaerales bacterium]|nr:alpha-L-fucosidase [Phycisphaerales bacterium]